MGWVMGLGKVGWGAGRRFRLKAAQGSGVPFRRTRDGAGPALLLPRVVTVRVAWAWLRHASRPRAWVGAAGTGAGRAYARVTARSPGVWVAAGRGVASPDGRRRRDFR
ncbi:hypothetical protein HPP92_000143 [Vanilla planifolia]|uniref:Uncharacterized protein n=1 Tax=Vanilla planifolia TaxID=51239 RepID=A0A835S527_VANPL|nr:hypothetical protein HPP92_000143 [Vanilla planifolia]